MKNFLMASFIGLSIIMAATAAAYYVAGSGGGGQPFTNPFTIKSTWRNAICNAGSAPVGIKVSGGTYVHGIAMFCGKLLSGKKVGPPQQMTGDASGGQVSVTKYCPKDYLIAGVKFRAGTFVDKIEGIQCQKRGTTSRQYVTIGIGGNGGQSVSAYCKSGNTVRNLKFTKGSWVDKLTVYCR